MATQSTLVTNSGSLNYKGIKWSCRPTWKGSKCGAMQ